MIINELYKLILYNIEFGLNKMPNYSPYFTTVRDVLITKVAKDGLFTLIDIDPHIKRIIVWNNSDDIHHAEKWPKRPRGHEHD